MYSSLETVKNTLKELESKIGKDQAEVDSLLIWFEKYLRAVYSAPEINKNGDEMKIALDAVFNIAVSMFRLIDKGNTGIDDVLAENLSKIRAKYLGD